MKLKGCHGLNFAKEVHGKLTPELMDAKPEKENSKKKVKVRGKLPNTSKPRTKIKKKKKKTYVKSKYIGVDGIMYGNSKKVNWYAKRNKRLRERCESELAA